MKQKYLETLLIKSHTYPSSAFQISVFSNNIIFLFVSVCCCKTKWRNMRSVFVRKQRMKPNIKGKPYYLNEYMKYLLPFLKGSAANPKQREEDNVEDTTTRDSPSPPHTEFVVNEEIDIEDVAEDDTGGDWTDGETNPLATNRIVGIKQEIEESAPALTWSKRRKKSSKSQMRESEPGTSRIKKQKTSSCFEDDPRRMFLLSLVPEVDEFTETQMRSFKRRVLDLIDEISEC